MNFVRLLSVIFSFGLLAAHFSRAGIFTLMILSLAIILVTVALLTACPGLVFRGKALKQSYKLGKSEK